MLLITQHYSPLLRVFMLCLVSTLFIQCQQPQPGLISVQKDDHILLVGNNLGSRMMNYGFFEAELQLRYPDSMLYIRNMCDGGNTPGFRPHSGRVSPWAFPGAEKFQTELANSSDSQGHFESPDDWLSKHEADVIISLFGYSESFEGPEGLDMFKGELAAFIDHTLSQQYNGESAPKLVLVTPIAFQDLSDQYDLPDGVQENENLELYTQAMMKVAQEKGVPIVNAFSPTKSWFGRDKSLTIDGFQLSEKGYRKFSPFLVNQVFGTSSPKSREKANVLAAVQDKNWFWHNDFKSPNGVHVFGRRYNPFGPDNYPAELAKLREMTAIRDTAIWMAAQGKAYDVNGADETTTTLPAVQTNYDPSRLNGSTEYLYGQDALDKLTVPEGYKIDLFASEREFEDLANPVQLSFDNKGRLWVATMPTYPHYLPGDERPNDKLIILEDTDNDGKADKQIVFADNLHLPLGFEFAPEGVYVSQGTNLVLLKDTDGDDQADEREILLSGFDDHDTHHAHSAYCADPSGAIYMGEGVFLHTNVETPYGTVRATNGGFYRYSPQRRHLERVAQLSIPNPWGIAFDEWGQNFFAETSGPDVRWMMPGSVFPRYGEANHKSFNLIEDAHRVRPTSGLEFVSSRHFPDEVQGDLLINNSIGFLGMKQHRMMDDTTGYVSTHRQDLVVGSDPNFRPVDMEFAPDGSLYLVDWHNTLIGHMQHNARDPYRDHVHGRIYRITYPSRPLVEPAEVDGASLETLLDNLKLPEYRTRYRTRRELRERNPEKVLKAIKSWVAELDQEDPNYEHHVLEALWVSWGLNQIDQELLVQMLEAEDFRARTAAARILRYTGHQVDNQVELLQQAAADPHNRVRLEALVAASWLSPEAGNEILEVAGTLPLDRWMAPPYETALAHLNDRPVRKKDPKAVWTDLKGKEREMYFLGMEIYSRDGHCATCHQPKGQGLHASGFPPLINTDWVLGDEERLIKLTLHGLMGPMDVLGKHYPGNVPMTPWGGMLNDEEIAAVLTYVRNSFGNGAPAIYPDKVAKVRDATKNQKGYYSPAELMEGK